MADTRKRDPASPPLGWAQEQLLLGILDEERRILECGSSQERTELETCGVRWAYQTLVPASEHPHLPAIVGHAATLLERRGFITRTPVTKTRSAGQLNRWVRLTPVGRTHAQHLAEVRAQHPERLKQPIGQQRTRQMPPADIPSMVGMAPDLADAVRPLLDTLSPADQVTAGMALVRAGLAAAGEAPPDHRVWFTVREVAALVRIGPDTIAKAITSGALSAVRTPYGHRISPEDLHAWMNRAWVDRRRRRTQDGPEAD